MPVDSPTTPIQRVGAALKTTALDMVSGYIQPVANIYSKWFGSSELVDIPVSKPYEGWTHPSEAARISVCGVRVPDGIILTHCQVSRTAVYRSTPLQEEMKRTSRLVPYTYPSNDPRTGERRTAVGFRIKSDKSSIAETKASIEQRANDAQSAERVAMLHAGMRSIEQGTTLANKIFAKDLSALDSAANAATLDRAKARLRKAHIGELNPRAVELRFTLTDVIGSRVLLASRFERLSVLHRMFCQNPSLKDDKSLSFPSDNAWLTEAARVTAEASRGCLVKLSSPGIDPYHVDIWFTTKFVHQEVPDSDLIFVQVVLTEFQSDLSDSCPDIVSAVQPSSPVSVPASPATPAKPSYVPGSGWAAAPGAES